MLSCFLNACTQLTLDTEKEANDLNSCGSSYDMYTNLEEKLHTDLSH